MTKKPPQEEFQKAYRQVSGDLKLLAERFDCTLQSIYNWRQKYSTATSNVPEDVGEIKELEFYVTEQKKSLNKPVNRNVKINLDESALIVCLSDTHFGSTYVDADRLLRDAKIIESTPNVYALFDGDLLDYPGTGPKDLLFDQAFPHPNVARNYARSYVKRLGHKILVMVSGCHSQWSYRETGEYFEERLRDDIVTKAVFPHSALIDLTVGDITYSLFMTHKPKSRSGYNPGHGMFRTNREDKQIDIGISAHFHKAGVAAQQIQGRMVYAVDCGTYKYIDNFPAKIGIVQQPLHIPGFYVDAKEKKVILLPDWEWGLPLVAKGNVSSE